MSTSVCLSAHVSQKPLVQTPQKLYVYVAVAMASSSFDNKAMCVITVMYFQSCGWRHIRHISYNGEYTYTTVIQHRVWL